MTADTINDRTQKLLGAQSMALLSAKHVAVFGLGGVGGHAAEALTRGGIRMLTLVDADTVTPSNLNRQIIATRETVGMLKTEAMKARLLSIRSDMVINCYHLFIQKDNVYETDIAACDYVIDAVDTVTAKMALAKACKDLAIPFISVMGAGNRLDPCAFRVAYLAETSGCPLARVMRRELHKQYGITRVKVVYSTERALKPEGNARIPGSVSFVPGAAGMIAAGEAIKDMMNAAGVTPG